ncbi:MAG: hypothetical protein LBD06_12370 [Candidatus Accumulibacter sp.]|nr:hypothetical protein [Accumulibacter sp.]
MLWVTGLPEILTAMFNPPPAIALPWSGFILAIVHAVAWPAALDIHVDFKLIEKRP